MDIKVALKTPWVRYTLIGVAVIGGFFILRSFMGGSAQTAQGGQSQPSAADMQQAQLDAQAASQASSQSFQLQALQLQQAGQLNLAHENNTTQLSMANVQLQGLHEQLQAQTTQQHDALQTQISLANVTAQEQMHISDNQTNVSLNQTNQQASAAKHSSDNSLIGGVIGAAISLF